MRDEDVRTMDLVWPGWAARVDGVSSVVVLSPEGAETNVVRRLFPGATVETSTRADWDLFTPTLVGWDLVVACNVFMYSSDPGLWMRNVLAACRRFWLQDAVRGNRGQDGRELGEDGDLTRFNYPPLAQSTLDGAFDLRTFDDRVVTFVSYPLDPQSRAVHFVAELRGDLPDPTPPQQPAPARRRRGDGGRP